MQCIIAVVVWYQYETGQGRKSIAMAVYGLKGGREGGGHGGSTASQSHIHSQFEN